MYEWSKKRLKNEFANNRFLKVYDKVLGNPDFRLKWSVACRVQVILFEIDCAIFYTNLHELFCQFISWTNWVNSGKLMNNCWISCQVMADMKKVYDDLIIINLYNIDGPDDRFNSDLTWKWKIFKWIIENKVRENLISIKFRYSEKATKIWPIFHSFFLTLCTYKRQIIRGRWAKFGWPSQNLWTLTTTLKWQIVCRIIKLLRSNEVTS